MRVLWASTIYSARMLVYPSFLTAGYVCLLSRENKISLSPSPIGRTFLLFLESIEVFRFDLRANCDFSIYDRIACSEDRYLNISYVT